MTQYQTSAELKSTAREKLTGKYGSSMAVSPVLVGITYITMFLPLYILILIPTIISATSNGSYNQGLFYIAMVVLAIICNIFTKMCSAGICLFHLNIACGRRHSVSDLFFGFRYQFKKTFALSTVLVLLSTLFLVPFYIFSYLEIFDGSRWSIWASVAQLAGTLLALPIQFALSQSFYLLLDFPKHSTTKLLTQSIQIMKGHKRRFLYIYLSFLPLELLAICSFYIGYLWVLPYENMVYTLFFLDLMKPKKATSYDSCINASESVTGQF